MSLIARNNSNHSFLQCGYTPSLIFVSSLIMALIFSNCSCVACRKRELPCENRVGRTELLELMLSNKVLPADPNYVDSDQINVICRAAHDGDLEILKLLQKTKTMPTNINTVYKDDTTVLIHAVFSGDAKTIDFVLSLPGIQVNVETENGTALSIAKGLHRAKSVTALLEAKGANVGIVTAREHCVPELTMPARSKPLLWDDAIEDDDS